MIPLPAGSSITVGSDGAVTVITVPYRSGGIARYGAGLFMLCWLGGWAYGWIQTSSTIMSGRGNFFIFFWLCAWTVGGAFAVYTLYRMLRPTVPESYRLMAPGVRYDSGQPSFDMSAFNRNTRPNWNTYFARRTRADLDRTQLESLHLRETATGNRLTVDTGATRLDLARDATEIEREWLYRVLTDLYSLSPAAQSKAADETRR
jgi:hypothetical protein